MPSRVGEDMRPTHCADCNAQIVQPRTSKRTRCTTCSKVRERDLKRKRRHENPERHREYTRKYRETHPEQEKARSRACHKRHYQQWRAQTRKKLYGITDEEYYSILLSRGGVCAICGSTQNNRSLAVDHDHETKRVRGLLCTRCNTTLGQFNDDPKMFQAAIDYLNRRPSGAATDGNETCERGEI